jgi:CHAD domain-containing protein
VATTGGARARTRGPVLSPSDPAGEAASATLRYYLRAFAGQKAGARSGDVESVHQLRVATRRLRATLRLFRPTLPEDAARRAGDDLSRLGREIGAVRDLDVLLLAIPARARRLDAAMRDALGPLDAALGARRKAAHASLLRTLDSPRCRALIARLETLTSARRTQPLADVATDLAKPLVRSMHRAGRRLDSDAPPDAFHRLRVRVKRLRYGLEALQGLGGRKVQKMLRRCEAMQEVLGDYQDAVSQSARLEEVAEADPLPPATLLAVGSLVQVLGRRARRRRRRFPALWRRLDRRRLRRAVLKELARKQGHPRARVLRMVRRTGT